MNPDESRIEFCLVRALVGLAACALFVPACGPTVFAGQAPIAVVGELPAPPPQPPPAPPKPKLVEVTADKIVIHDKIHFEFDKAVIREQSYALLDEIAATILANDHIKELSVEGHTDDVGAEKYNLKLSDARARAVREYLAGKGVAEPMLLARGHGESLPISDNTTDAGREANRRVEFIITKQDEQRRQVYIDPTTGEQVAVAPEAQPTPPTAVVRGSAAPEGSNAASEPNAGTDAKPTPVQTSATIEEEDER